MPVILHSEEYTLWLSGDERQRGLLTEFVRPYPAEAMVGYPVSPLVNSTRNKGLELTAEVQLNSA
jgi:putative SOS response-associated peptidase YedK